MQAFTVTLICENRYNAHYEISWAFCQDNVPRRGRRWSFEIRRAQKTENAERKKLVDAEFDNFTVRRAFSDSVHTPSTSPNLSLQHDSYIRMSMNDGRTNTQQIGGISYFALFVSHIKQFNKIEQVLAVEVSCCC